MENARKFVDLKDIVLVTLLTALCMVAVTLVVLPFAANITLVLWVVSGLDMLICGAIYMLMVAKAPRYGTQFIFSFLFAVYYFITNGMILISLMILVVGILRELLMLKDGYHSPVRLTVAYGLFGLGIMYAPIVLIAVTKEQVIAAVIANGFTREYAETMFAVYSPLNILIGTLLTMVGAVLGCLSGYRMLKKHFRPAGIVEPQ
jgi:energy-coupling factor transport system substrate-specific component